jgi:hypothetical protein
MKVRCPYDKLVPLSELKPHPKNRNKHPQEQIQRLAQILEYQGVRKPIIVSNRSGSIVSGHGRLEAAKILKWKEFPVSFQNYDDEAQEYADLIADNAVALWAEIDLSGVNNDLADLDGTFNLDLLGIEGFTVDVADKAPQTSGPSLADKFLVPPFSVLDQRQGYWRERKEHWMSLGIKSDEGRAENLLKMSDTILEPDPKKRAKANKGASYNDQDTLQAYMHIDKIKAKLGISNEEARKMILENPRAVLERIGAYRPDSAAQSTGTSIFDPVLCELIYRWFSKPGHLVLDPFAGGSVRGIVAAKLGRPYYGSELRREQVEANVKQARQIITKKAIMPEWVCQDSRDLHKAKIQADLVFSCPPYADLEVYSDMTQGTFPTCPISHS